MLFAKVVIAGLVAATAVCDHGELEYSIDAKCHRTTGQAAALTVSWQRRSSTLQQQRTQPAEAAQRAKGADGLLVLVGEFDHVLERFEQFVDVEGDGGLVQMRVPDWALTSSAFSSLHIFGPVPPNVRDDEGQEGRPLARSDFMHLGSLCGLASQAELTGVDGAVNIPVIPIS